MMESNAMIKHVKANWNVRFVLIVWLVLSPVAMAIDPVPEAGSPPQGAEGQIALCEQHVAEFPVEAEAMLQGRTCAEFFGAESAEQGAE